MSLPTPGQPGLNDREQGEELATERSTLYGDSAGGVYAPIKDVPKTLVWELATWRTGRRKDAARIADPGEPIPRSRAPGARPRVSVDSDSLPDLTEVLDADLDTTTWLRDHRAEDRWRGHHDPLS